MPRFNLYPTPNPDGTDADRRLELGWSRDGTIQIGTTQLQPGADRHQEFYEAVPGEPYKRSWDGQYIHLDDRGQINELIRNLRRARDQVFGRDE